MFKSCKHCLTPLGFSLNIAPLVMKAILKCVVSQDSAVKEGTSAYIDNVLVNEDIVMMSRIEQYFAHAMLMV